MVILFAQNREQQVRTLDDQVASRATPRLRRTSSYFVVLRTWGKVIDALAEQRPHVPYRDSQLTRVLQEAEGFQLQHWMLMLLSWNLRWKHYKRPKQHTHKHTLPSHHKKSNQKCYSKGVQGQGMSMDSMDTGHLVVDGVWTCLDIRWPQALGGNCRTTLLVAASGCAQHAATA